MITPIILSGGSGTRLWPLSRKSYPKQFINLLNEDISVFQDTVLRLPKKTSEPLIICNEEHRFLVAEQLRELKKNALDIILEPIGKNTAPAITLAAISLINKKQDPILLVLPADHKIDDLDAFHHSINIAEKLAEKNKLVTFGVIPNQANTNFGYIEADIHDNQKFHKVISFTEKPNIQIAKEFIKSKNYFWNSGMFMFKASTFINEIKKFAPKIFEFCNKSLHKSHPDIDFTRIDITEFNNCPNQSIDYALMEHTDKSFVVPIDINWHDIGSWENLKKLKKSDKNGNSLTGDVIINDTTNTFVHSSHKLVSVHGVTDLIIVDTQDALMVTSRDNPDSIKNIVQTLEKENRPELNSHRKVLRPWGYFDSIDMGNGFHVKRILVKPGQKISLQKHLHRSEHWVVVAGTAKITCGKKHYLLQKNQSAYIPKGETHRLENQDKIPLEIIEIQTGNYLEEDDIIRLEDSYQRN